MPFVHDAVYNPRKLFLRKALFQIHLWSGIFLSAYVIVIALTGSILVFENELTRTTLPATLSAYDPRAPRLHPHRHGSFSPRLPHRARHRHLHPLAHHPRLHVRRRHRRQLPLHPHRRPCHRGPPPPTPAPGSNGPTTSTPSSSSTPPTENKSTPSAPPSSYYSVSPESFSGGKASPAGLEPLTVSLHSNWRRINFDLHHAIGFWTLFIVFWWSLSGIYFGFYKPIVAAVNRISPLQGMASPILPATTPTGPPPRRAAIHPRRRPASLPPRPPLLHQ